MVLPNQLTILRIVLTPVFLFFFLSDSPVFKLISLGIFIIAALTDWYDGWLARKFNYITNWGKFWDPLADDLIITTLRAYADYKDFSFPTSYYAKWKTFLQMAFLYYLLIAYVGYQSVQIYIGGTNVFYTLMDKSFIYISMIIITAITFHSGVTYIFKNRKLIKELFRRET